MRQRVRGKVAGDHGNEWHFKHQRTKVSNGDVGSGAPGRAGQRHLRTRGEDAAQAQRRGDCGEADAPLRQLRGEQTNHHGLGRCAQISRQSLYRAMFGLFHHRVGRVDMHGTHGYVFRKVIKEKPTAHSRGLFRKSHCCRKFS